MARYFALIIAAYLQLSSVFAFTPETSEIETIDRCALTLGAVLSNLTVTFKNPKTSISLLDLEPHSTRILSGVLVLTDDNRKVFAVTADYGSHGVLLKDIQDSTHLGKIKKILWMGELKLENSSDAFGRGKIILVNETSGTYKNLKDYPETALQEFGLAPDQIQNSSDALIDYLKGVRKDLYSSTAKAKRWDPNDRYLDEDLSAMLATDEDRKHLVNNALNWIYMPSWSVNRRQKDQVLSSEDLADRIATLRWMSKRMKIYYPEEASLVELETILSELEPHGILTPPLAARALKAYKRIQELRENAPRLIWSKDVIPK